MTAARVLVAAGVAVGYVGGTVVGYTILLVNDFWHYARLARRTTNLGVPHGPV